jgi:uncharacterized RDD family membrane protein YckC
METKKNKKWSEKPLVRTLLTVSSILLVIVGLVSLSKENTNYLSSFLFIGLGSIYLWTEIQVIRNPKVLEDDVSSISIVQLRKSELAFWWQRLISFIIDIAICFSGGVFLIMILRLAPENTNYIMVSIIFIYYNLTETIMNKTVGKVIFGLKVIDTKSWSKPEFSQILIRTVCRFIPFEALSFISANPNGWHDSFSNTVVVKR